MYLEVQGRVLPFWKPPINISMEPDCHGCCSALNVCQAMLKNCIHFSTLMHMTVVDIFEYEFDEWFLREKVTCENWVKVEQNWVFG